MKQVLFYVHDGGPEKSSDLPSHINETEYKALNLVSDKAINKFSFFILNILKSCLNMQSFCSICLAALVLMAKKEFLKYQFP